MADRVAASLLIADEERATARTLLNTALDSADALALAARKHTGR